MTKADRVGGRPRVMWRGLWHGAVVVGLAGAVTAFLAVAAVRHGFFDLRVYYGAINYWMHDGGSLYDYILAKSTYGFTYPPFAAFVMLPMSAVSWHVAIVISVTASVLATTVLLYWLVDPIARRHGWTRWFTLAVAACLAAAFEPLRETVNFGQVNMLLVFLVAADLLLLVAKGSRWGGVGVGLATAIKLTPGVFIIYLLVTRRWRAALVSSLTAGVATLAAAVLAPDASRVFWTDAVWNTDRIGSLAFISNQSLQGAVARLNPSHPSTALWAMAVLAVVALWYVRVRRAAAAGDVMTGFALTGILGCLLSPVTWVHHLVWVGPAVILTIDSGFAGRGRRRVALLAFGAFAYALLCSRLVWEYHQNFNEPVTWALSNAYVWISIALLAVVPIRRPRVAQPPQLDQLDDLGRLDRELAGLLGDTPRALSVRSRWSDLRDRIPSVTR